MFGKPLRCLLHIDPKSPAPFVKGAQPKRNLPLIPKFFSVYTGHKSPSPAVGILTAGFCFLLHAITDRSLTAQTWSDLTYFTFCIMIQLLPAV
jgi:hypothetical protein